MLGLNVNRVQFRKTNPGAGDGYVHRPIDDSNPAGKTAQDLEAEGAPGAGGKSKDNKRDNERGTRNKARHNRHNRRPHGRDRRHGRRRDPYDGPVYGALDLGTNNCRLLIARPSRRGFVILDAFSRIIRLGEGLGQSLGLSDVAMERTIEALMVCSEKMIRRDVKRSRLIATEACRVAENGSQFIADVRRETGLLLEIVTRETEAKLAVMGCSSLLDRNSDWALVFDIGGGSSELVLLDLRAVSRDQPITMHHRLAVQDCIVAWTSIPVGVVTLSEKWGGRFVDRAIFDAMIEYVFEYLEQFERDNSLKQLIGSDPVHLLGTSGTVTTVAGVHLGLPRYDRRRVDGYWLDTRDAQQVSNVLVDLSYDNRVAQPCIGPDRADLVLAGCAILEAVIKMWPAPRLRVADRGLREGILTTLMAEDGQLGDGRSRRRS